MKLTLNPYALVAETQGMTNFILSDHTDPVQLILTEEQSEILDHMHRQAFYDYDALCQVFGGSVVDGLIGNGCFVQEVPDTVGIHSRSDAFFATHQMPEARQRLSQSKVLILGAGGIGTHMAWHMVSLGVSKVTIVDFDTVAESNFNRQLLFDRSDIGKIKVEVLKEKLTAINPSVQVETVCTRISSQEALEKICLADHYDLIIKALDSPAQFPLWLDRVAEKHRLTYISGITMRENVLIGPSYIPGQDACGWTELMNVDLEDSQKIYGTAPSLGIMLYHISDELAAEAFKILTGYGSLKYRGKVLCKNIFTNQEYIFDKNTKKAEPENKTQNTAKTLWMNVLCMVTMAAASFVQPWFFLGGVLLAMALPFFLYEAKQDVMRSTFLNATIISVGALVMLTRWVNVTSAASLVSSMAVLFGAHSAITLLMCVLNFVICRVLRRGERI